MIFSGEAKIFCPEAHSRVSRTGPLDIASARGSGAATSEEVAESGREYPRGEYSVECPRVGAIVV